MPRKFHAGAGGKREFRKVPEGWYAVEIAKIKEEPGKDESIRFGVGCKVIDGPFAGEYAWLNLWIGTQPFTDKDGNQRQPTNYAIRKLQHMINPTRHADPSKQKIGEGETIEFILEDEAFFMGFKFAVEVKHREWKASGGRSGVSVEVGEFRDLQDAALLINATRDTAPAHGGGDMAGPWDSEGYESSGSKAHLDADPDDDDLPY